MAEVTQEMDDDLTMINRAPSEAEQLGDGLEGSEGVQGVEPPEVDVFAGLDMENSVNMGPDIKDQGDVDDYIKGMQQDAFIDRSREEGSRDLDLDMGRSMYESVDSARADNQS